MAEKSNKGLQPLAMVAPRPAMPPERVRRSLQPEAVPSLELAMVLQQLGNNRAYTVISSHGNSWKVHFEGDLLPKTIRIVKGKPVIE